MRMPCVDHALAMREGGILASRVKTGKKTIDLFLSIHEHRRCTMFASHRTGHVKPALLLALALALLLAVPVSADGPVVYTGTWEDDYIPEAYQVCPGMELRDHEVLTYRETHYFDNEGNLTSIKIHFLGTDNWYNPQNPGVELSGSFSATTEVDLQTGEYINAHGLPVHITIPGYGTALVRAGFWSRYPNSHLAGKDSFEDPDDIAAFCSYLAGD
jgi:hypothetical protein